MRRDIRFCDRCGLEYEELKEIRIDRYIFYFHKYASGVYVMGNPSNDLCPPCEESLKKWFKRNEK